jgi:CspA family cold shock protein
VFVHVSALDEAGIRDLEDGQKISYEIVENRGKEAASSLKLVD